MERELESSQELYRLLNKVGDCLSAGLIFHPVFCEALSVPVSIACSSIRTKRDVVQIHLTVSYSEIWVTIVWHQLNLS
jgi:hypothetical protein